MGTGQVAGIAVAGSAFTNLEINAVELVKAGPSSRGCQTLEELSHGEVVQRVTAVKDHTLPSQGFCQILQSANPIY